MYITRSDPGFPDLGKPLKESGKLFPCKIISFSFIRLICRCKVCENTVDFNITESFYTGEKVRKFFPRPCTDPVHAGLDLNVGFHGSQSLLFCLFAEAFCVFDAEERNFDLTFDDRGDLESRNGAKN